MILLYRENNRIWDSRSTRDVQFFALRRQFLNLNVKSNNKKEFLDAFPHLCSRVCPSVRPTVRLSVGQSIRHTQVEFIRNWTF